MTGIQLARQIKPDATVIGPSDSGDFYDPACDAIRLSEATWYGSTPEDLAHAAHECGHAIQRHAETWTWRAWRLLPITSPLWWVFVAASSVAGILGDMGRAWAFAAVAICLSALRYLVVLALEREASVLALREMTGLQAKGPTIDLLRVRTALRRNLKTYAVR